MNKKSAVPDDVMYKGFTMGCPYVTKGKHIKPINASVRCRDDRKGWPVHCPNCGWNPEVKKRRLVAMVGEMAARRLLAQSEELEKKTKQEINEGKYAYV